MCIHEEKCNEIINSFEKNKPFQFLSITEFKQKFSELIFGDDVKELIKKIADSPERYIGLFRPTRPKAKVLQNLLQSHEIKFGNALEIIFEYLFSKNSFEIFGKNIKYKGKKLNIDLFFKKDNILYLVEQKVRDDHDSSKKEGQIKNFQKKIDYIIDNMENYNINSEENIVAIMFFVDPDLRKNKNYYEKEIEKLKRMYGIKIYLFYGKEFFDFFGFGYFWNLFECYLYLWKKEIPEIPELNFDKNYEKSAQKIFELPPSTIHKLLSNNKLWKEKLPQVLFPEGKTLEHLKELYLSDPSKTRKTIYKNIVNLITEILERYYKK